MREEEGAVGVDAAQFAGRGAAAVETPVPGGKDEDVGEPESAGGFEQGDGGLRVFGECRDEQAEGPDHVEGDEGAHEDAEDSVEGVEAALVGRDGGNGEHADDGKQEPVGANGEGFGEREAEASDGEERDQCGPAGLGFDVELRRSGGHGSEIAQVVDDLGCGPVLGADEFAADDAVGVDDVSFRRACGVEGVAGLVGGVVDDGHVVKIVVGEVLAVVGGLGVEGDGDDDDVGYLLLKLLQGRPLGGTVNAPAGPEIEYDDFALVLFEADGLTTVADHDGGCAFADLGGVGGAVAACGAEHTAQSTEHRHSG